ncbi:MAG TPA: histidine kinase [Bryobacteraceae bacterium]|jgi:LytS/YehU family sensor histidine kinase|nr:histidine kinase [Bryobacteraceae bacterium]
MQSHGRFLLKLFLVCNAACLLLFGYKYLDFVTRDTPVSPMTPFIEEVTGAYALFVLLPLLIGVVRRFPFDRAHWIRSSALHWAIATAFAFIHTTMMAVSRHLIFPLVGMGPYDYGRMPVRYFMEYCFQLIVYVVVLSLVQLLDQYRAAHRRELETAQLENRLAQAQLQNLRLQLQPHFIFNALNTVSSIMYEDVRAADEMIARLSDFLRLTLHSSQAQEVPLEDELRILDLYLNVMRARFEDRLSVSIDVDDGAKAALVPQLILQPLVENSLRHGIDPETSRVDVAVTARRTNGSLWLQVRDRGRGIQEGRSPLRGQGIGLSNTAERLSRLYGKGQSLHFENGPEGGLLVTVKVPFHTA